MLRTRRQVIVDEAGPVADHELRQRDDRTVATASMFSAAQAAALAVGVISLILGGVALARTGLSFSDLEATHVTVFGLDATSLLAVIEVLFGLLAIGAGAMPGGSRGLMVTLGVLALGFGVVVFAAMDQLHATLGVHGGNGWLAVIFGAVLLVGALLPTSEARTYRQRTAIDR